MAVALALAGAAALIAFAFFLMWGMPSIFRGHHNNDGSDVGYGGGGHSGGDGGGHGGGDAGGGSH